MPSATECLRRRLWFEDLEAPKMDKVIGFGALKKEDKVKDACKFQWTQEGFGRASDAGWNLVRLIGSTATLSWTNKEGQWRGTQILAVGGILSLCTLASMSVGGCTTAGGLIPIFIMVTYFSAGMFRNSYNTEDSEKKKNEITF